MGWARSGGVDEYGWPMHAGDVTQARERHHPLKRVSQLPSEAGEAPMSELQQGYGNAALVRLIPGGRRDPTPDQQNSVSRTDGSLGLPRSPGGERPKTDGARVVVGGLQHCAGNRAVQRLLAGGGADRFGDEEVAQRINAGAGTGQSLEPSVRRRLEPVLGVDLAGVGVHTGPEADDLAHQLGARAFTSGQDIWFSAGAYDPSSEAGLRTLAHEVAHTVQQAAGPVDGTATDGGALAVSHPSDRFELAAHAAADAVLAGTSITTVPGGEAAASGRPSQGRAIQREVPDEKKDNLDFKFQMNPKLQAEYYPQTPEALQWAGVNPSSYIPTGGQWDLKQGGLTSSGHLNLAGGAGELRYKQLVMGKDGKPEYRDVFEGKGDFDFATKEGQAKAFANLDFDPVKIKALAELSSKEGFKGSAEATAELEALKLKAILAGGSGALDAKLMADYGFDKSSISAMLGAGSGGFSAEALAKLNFDKTQIEAMMKYGPAGAEGSLKGKHQFGLGEIFGYLNANPQMMGAGIGAKLKLPGQYGLGGEVGTSGYSATATVPMPFTAAGLQPYAEPSIKGPWDGTPQVGLTGGVTIPME